MADCPSFGSSSEVSVWYGVDPDPALPLPGTFTWLNVPITGESLNSSLSSTISETITPARSYAGSLLTSGEVGGDLNIELVASTFFDNMLLAVIQSSTAFSAGAVAGTAGVAVSAVGALVDDDRTITLTGLTATEGASYSVVINGVNFTYVAGATPSTASIATGIAAAIDAGAYTATAGTDVITVSAGAGLQEITFTSWAPASWAPGEAVINGSTKNCLTFMKRVQVSSTTWDWYVFRGCQIGKLTIDMKPGALMTGSISIMGIKPDTALEAAEKPAGWTLTNAESVPFMSGVDTLKSLEIQNSLGVDTGITAQDFTLTLDNQLRAQQAVGLGHPFSAGIASGRFMASASATAYYASPAVYNAFLNDAPLKIAMELRDSEGAGWNFLFDNVKVTSGSLPEASGPDQDLTVKTEFRAFESISNGTVKITKYAV